MRWFNVLAAMAFVAALASADVLDCVEGRWGGRWLEVAATAYTPTNAIDSAYHAAKGTRWRWVLADGRTNAKRTPYGIAVKLTQGGDGRWRPALPFGTRIYVPTGHGYLDRSRAEERVFTVDDGSASSLYDARIGGRLHMDLRWVDTPDAVAWSGAEGHQALRVFIIERDLPRLPPPPIVVWPPQMIEAELPPIPPAQVNAPQRQPGEAWARWENTVIAMGVLLSLSPMLLGLTGVLVGLTRKQVPA